MRKFIVSNLLLFMFLVGAAAGFITSNIGWWGLYVGERDLNQLYNNNTANLQQVEGLLGNVLQEQVLLTKAIKEKRLSASESAALVHADAGLKRQLEELQTNGENREYWRQLAQQHARFSASREQMLGLFATDTEEVYRFYAADTQPLYNQFLQMVYQSFPAMTQSARQTYGKAAGNNRIARDILLAVAILATVFFPLIAWLVYRETREKRNTAIQLDRERSRFKTLFESADDGIVLLHGHQFIDCNPAALKLFAIPSVSMFTARNFSHLNPAQQPDGGISSNALRTRIEDCLKSGSQRFEWIFKTIEDKEFPAEVVMNPVPLGDETIIQMTVRNITERKQAESAMRLAAQVFENSLDGIAITDANTGILTVNRMFNEITGYSLQEVIGRNPSMLSSGRQPAEFYRDMWSRLKEEGKWQGEIWNIRKDGDIYPQWLSISRVQDEHGKTINYVGVFTDISERKSAEERILHQVYHDHLTDLPNRALFMDRLNQALTLAKRHPENSVVVMFVDMDRFKLVNDTLGHDAGDRLLQLTAQRLKDCVREIDTVARVGGDEFTIILAKVAHAEDAVVVVHKILETFKAPFHLDNEELYVSLSIGISLFPVDGADVEALLKNADMAMYRAKSTGGARYEMYNEKLSIQENRRLALDTALHKALERQELELQYQPQFDFNTGELIGFEALLRWWHPTQGLLYPDAFIGVAEETGLIVPIGEWVLHTACVQAQAWREQGLKQNLMAVNLSTRQFQHSDIAQQVTSALKESGLPPDCLELEITESVMMQDIEASIKIMHALAELGVQFAVDDFGTGYSSLAYLKKLPIRTLKIDHSFIRDIAHEPNDAAIVGAIIVMSQQLNLRVIAEGIESHAQHACLKKYVGVGGQGNLLGYPMPAKTVTAWLAGETLGPPSFEAANPGAA